MLVNSSGLIKTGDTTFDKIHAFYLDENKHKLSAKHEEIRSSWVTAWTLLVNTKHTRLDAANILEKDHGRSRAQAYRDIANAEKLFGKITAANKEGRLAIFLTRVDFVWKKAVEKDNLKEMTRALELMGKYEKFDQGDDVSVNLDKLKDKPLKLSVKKTVLEMVVASLETGVVDFNNPVVVDVDHEDVQK